MLRIPGSPATTEAEMLQFPKRLQAAGPRVASPRHRLCTRPLRRSLKAAGPGQGATWRLMKRQMVRHAMQREVGYLFSGLWVVEGKGRGEKSREAESRERKEKRKLPL